MLLKSNLSLVDDIGEVFIDTNKVYRGINSKYISVTKEIIECGLIDELVTKKLFPETIISTQKLMGYDFVLEHRKINPTTYPFEWSPEMLRNAGLTTLEVNNICHKYGYELKDAHPYNILYEYNRCYYIDFGSIQKRQTTHNLSRPFSEEFLRSYYYPLYLYSKGAKHFFITAFLKLGGLIPHLDFFLYKRPLYRTFSTRFVENMISCFFRYNSIYSINNKRLPLFFSHTSAIYEKV